MTDESKTPEVPSPGAALSSLIAARLAECEKADALRGTLPYGPWEFEGEPPYNLQVPYVICEGEPDALHPDGKHYGHPLVQMKTLKGWEPSRDLADFIVNALNNHGRESAALRALSLAVAALEKIGAETTEPAMRVSTSEQMRQLHMQVGAMAECANSALSAAAREIGAETDKERGA